METAAERHYAAVRRANKEYYERNKEKINQKSREKRMEKNPDLKTRKRVALDLNVANV